MWIFHFRVPKPTFRYWAVLLRQEAWQLPLRSRLAEIRCHCLDLQCVAFGRLAAWAEPALESDNGEEGRTWGALQVTEFVLSSAASRSPGSSAGLGLVLFGVAGSLQREADRELMGLWAPCTPSP